MSDSKSNVLLFDASKKTKNKTSKSFSRKGMKGAPARREKDPEPKEDEPIWVNGKVLRQVIYEMIGAGQIRGRSAQVLLLFVQQIKGVKNLKNINDVRYEGRVYWVEHLLYWESGKASLRRLSDTLSALGKKKILCFKQNGTKTRRYFHPDFVSLLLTLIGIRERKQIGTPVSVALPVPITPVSDRREEKAWVPNTPVPDALEHAQNKSLSPKERESDTGVLSSPDTGVPVIASYIEGTLRDLTLRTLTLRTSNSSRAGTEYERFKSDTELQGILRTYFDASFKRPVTGLRHDQSAVWALCMTAYEKGGIGEAKSLGQWLLRKRIEGEGKAPLRDDLDSILALVSEYESRKSVPERSEPYYEQY